MSATDLLDAYLNDTVAAHNGQQAQLSTQQAGSSTGIVRAGSRRPVSRSVSYRIAARADKVLGSKQGSLQHSRSLLGQTQEAETAAGDMQASRGLCCWDSHFISSYLP